MDADRAGKEWPATRLEKRRRPPAALPSGESVAAGTEWDGARRREAVMQRAPADLADLGRPAGVASSEIYRSDEQGPGRPTEDTAPVALVRGAKPVRGEIVDMRGAPAVHQAGPAAPHACAGPAAHAVTEDV